MNDTPETDAKASPHIGFYSCATVPAEFARKLERERDEARARVEIITPNENNPVAKFFSSSNTLETDEAVKASNGQWSFVLKETCQRLERERDEAQKILSSIYRWIERNHQDGFLDSLTYEENLERIHDTLFDRLASETDNAEYYRERYEQLKDKLAQERDEAREELAEAKRESENLARSIYRTEYSDNDTGWELLESVAGVISQIDNMYAGVREQRDEAREDLKITQEAWVKAKAERVEAMRERDEAREDAEHWKTEYLIVASRLCGKKHPRDNGIISEHEIIPKLERERDNWEQTAADYLEGMHYYRGLVQEIGETIGEAACLQDDGGKVDSVLCAKVPELVEELKRERDELKKIVEQRILVGAEIHDKANSPLKQSNRTEAECEALRKQLTAATSALRQIHLEVGDWIRSTIIVEE